MLPPAAGFHAAIYGDIVNYITNAQVKLFFRVALSRWGHRADTWAGKSGDLRRGKP